MITSPSNQRIKYVRSLRESKTRREERRFLIDGVREIQRALKSGVRILECYSTRNDDFLGKSRIPIWQVTNSLFEKMQYGDRNEGFIAVAEMDEKPLDKIALPPNPLICVLEGIEKPGNIGAVFRSADGAGLDAVVLSDCTDIYNPNVIRASLGTVFQVQTAVSERPTKWLSENGIKIAAAKCDGAIAYSEFDFTQPCAVVLGAESTGLSKRWEGIDVVPIKIPMLGIADSLNISAAAAVLFYHARSQREHCKP